MSAEGTFNSFVVFSWKAPAYFFRVFFVANFIAIQKLHCFALSSHKSYKTLPS